MKSEQNPYTRESKSNGRRSSILKRQDSCFTSEGTDGNTDCPRTPRRVSFASTAMVRYLHHLSDDSSSTAASSSDISSGSSQCMEHDSVFTPDPIPPSQALRCEGDTAVNTSLTEEFLSTSLQDQPHVLVKGISTFLKDVEVNPGQICTSASSAVSEQNKTIMYTSMNMSISDSDQLSHSVLMQDGGDDKDRRFATARHQEEHNHTIFYTDIDECGCSMDITSNCSKLSNSLCQEEDENFHHDTIFNKGELQIKPGLNRRPSFADEETNESSDDQRFMKMATNTEQRNIPDCTIIFSNSGRDEVEVTQNITKSITSIANSGEKLSGSIVLKPKLKSLDDLFQLVKVRNTDPVLDCNTEENVSHDLEDMEITGEFIQTICRTALSDITTLTALTPIEEMSLISLADQENRTSNSSIVLQAEAQMSKLNRGGSHLEQMYGLRHNSSSLNSDIGLEMAIVSPQNKENCPIQSVVYNSLTAASTKNFQFGTFSHSSMVKINHNVVNLRDQTTSDHNEEKIHKDYNTISVTNKSIGIPISVASIEGKELSVQKDISTAGTHQNQRFTTAQLKSQELPRKVPEENVAFLSQSSVDSRFKDGETTSKLEPGECSIIVVDSDLSKYPVSLQLSQSYVCNSRQIDKTDLSKTIYTEDAGEEKILIRTARPWFTNLVSGDDKSDRAKSSNIELTERPNKTICMNGEKDLQETKELHNSCMEVTEGLSKTIHVGSKDNIFPSKTIHVDQQLFEEKGLQETKELHNSCMEVTEGLSKTIHVGSKDNSCPSKTIHVNRQLHEENSLQETKELHNSCMEVTEGLSKTIHVGSKNNIFPSKTIHVNRQLYEENSLPVTKELHNSCMEVTEGLSKTIHVGSKDNSCPSKTIHANRQLHEENSLQETKELHNSCMEVTEGLSKTIHVGSKNNSCPSKTIHVNRQLYEEKDLLVTKELHNSCMEVTEGLSKIIHVGSKDNSCPSKTICVDRQLHEEKDLQETKKLHNSCMEVTEGLSKTIHVRSKDNSCPSKLNHDHPLVSEINNDCSPLDDESVDDVYRVRNKVSSICSSGRTNNSFIDRSSKCDLAITNIQPVVNDGNEFSHTLSSSKTGNSLQTCLTTTEYTDLNTCSIKSHDTNLPKILDSKKSEVRTFQMEFVGVSQYNVGNTASTNSLMLQTLDHDIITVGNSRSSSNYLETKQESVRRVSERNMETYSNINNLQENSTVQIADQKREELRQTLIKEIGLPLSLSKYSNTLDLFHRRRTSNLDLLLGRRNNGQGKKNQTLNFKQNLNKTTASSGESNNKYLSNEIDVDTFQRLEEPTCLTALICENTSRSFCSEKSDRTNTTDARLKIENVQNTDSEQLRTNLSPDNIDSSKVFSSRCAQLTAPSSSVHEDLCSDALELSAETLNDQEMLELTDEIVDFNSVTTLFSYRDEDSMLLDLQSVSEIDHMKINLKDVYKSLDIPKLEGICIKSICVHKVATSTVKEKLIAKVVEMSRLDCMQQHVNELEAVVNRTKQKCTEKLIQLSTKPPDVLVALQDKEFGNCVSAELKTKTQEMIHSCRMSAQILWKRHKTDYLLKYSATVKAGCQALNCQVEKVISDTDRVLDLITNIDKCLQEVDMLCGHKQELAEQQTELDEIKSETQHMKAHCKQMDKKVMLLTNMNRESMGQLTSIESANEVIEERLSYMSSFIEWTVVQQLHKEIHFGFLFGTIILQVHLVDCGTSYKKISRINLLSKLGVKSKSWAKLVHNLAISSIDCDKLQHLYKNYDQMHQLLVDVSSVVCEARQLSNELRLANLKHGLSIEDNRLRLTVSNRKTRQKVGLDTTVPRNLYSHFLLQWNVTTILGTVSSQNVKSAVDRIEAGPKYITRVLSCIEQLLGDCKG